MQESKRGLAAGINFVQQQAKFDAFVDEFNNERPHELLEMKLPTELYLISPRKYQGLPELEYPFHDKTVLVTSCRRIRMHNNKINLSQVFSGNLDSKKSKRTSGWSPL